MFFQYFDTKFWNLNTILNQIEILIVQSTIANQTFDQIVLTMLLYFLCNLSKWYIFIFESNRKWWQIVAKLTHSFVIEHNFCFQFRTILLNVFAFRILFVWFLFHMFCWNRKSIKTFLTNWLIVEFINKFYKLQKLFIFHFSYNVATCFQLCELTTTIISFQIILNAKR